MVVFLGAWCFDVTVKSCVAINSCFYEVKYPFIIICNDTLNKQHTVLFFYFLLWFSSLVGFVDL